MVTKTNSREKRRYFHKIGTLVKKTYHYSYTPVIFSFLTVALFGWYAIKPTIQTILYLKREIQDKTSVSQKMEDKISSLIEAQMNIESLQNQLPLVSEALPETPELINLVSQLKNLALINNASLSAIQTGNTPLYKEKIGNKTRSAKLVNVPLTVSITGPYPAIQSFLSGLFEMRRLVTVDSLNIVNLFAQPGASRTAGSNLRLVLKLNTYYLD